MGAAVRPMSANPLPFDKSDTPLDAAHLNDVLSTDDIDYKLITDRKMLAQFLAAAVALSMLISLALAKRSSKSENQQVLILR